MPAWQHLLVHLDVEIQSLLPDFQNHSDPPALALNRALADMRKRYVQKVSDLRCRNVIAYYSGFQSKSAHTDGSRIEGLAILDADRDAFMRSIHGLDRDKGLDLLLHTPGGEIAATQTIVRYLVEMFKGDIEVFVPHTAMSGGTSIALASRKLHMAAHSCIGPIDAQVGGIPAKGVLAEIDRAHEEIKKDPSREVIWKYVLSKYTPTFIESCINAIEWSEEYAEETLREGMLKDDPDAEKNAKAIVDRLADYGENKTHSRQIGYKEAIEIGLPVERLESSQELQDAVLSAHHLFVHTFNKTATYKIVTSSNNSEFIQTTG